MSGMAYIIENGVDNTDLQKPVDNLIPPLVAFSFALTLVLHLLVGMITPIHVFVVIIDAEGFYNFTATIPYDLGGDLSSISDYNTVFIVFLSQKATRRWLLSESMYHFMDI
ncbi:hypothetical protein PoB_000490600 [Plakobranchus ocellatus]|uniref:Uncharacterized protein n=1 Tax=Plakobranchus ocellatus TaxID=259542 RepID=A0AAV3Y7K8_9GAST|nr:hypothetical protein PoB_000490600 [Plakobranchus ocellatus]